MLALPLQRGENVDMSTVLYSFLQTQYGEEGIGKLSADVPAFQLLRDNAICVVDPSDVGMANIQRYHFHMSHVAPRFREYEGELKFAFNWFDGFRNSRAVATHSLYVDWACILWNLGALESQRGARIDRSSEEGVRNASKHFQQAAGIFDFIRKNMAKDFQGPTVIGLSDEGLHMASQLMLAQAQLCFYEKAVKDRKTGSMKPAVVAKLAIQTSQYYAAVRDSCNGATLSAVMDTSWAHHCDYQAKSFGAAGEFWQAQSVKENALARGCGYGEEITRLAVAEKIMRSGLDSAAKNKLGTGLVASGEALIATIVAQKNKAIQENNTIYMDSVPSEISLAPVVGISMVKPSPMPENTNTEAPMFKDVLPKSVRQLRGELRDELSSMKTQAQAISKDALEGGRATLNAMSLPGALETYRSGSKLPEHLITKILRVQEMGGRVELQSKLEEIEAASKRAFQSMVTIDETLAREERTDSQFRSRYPTWTGPASSTLTNDIRITNARMREAFTHARESDAGIVREMNDPGFDTWTKTICSPVPSIESLLPLPPQPLIDFSEVAAGMDPAQTNAQRLEKKLHEVAVLIELREKAVASIVAIVDTDITDRLLSAVAVGSDPSSVVDTQKSLCSAQLNAITSSIDRQQALLVEVGAINEAFQKSLQTDPVIMEKDRIIKELEFATTRYFNQHATLVAGITFYSNLQSRLSTLQQSSDDLCYSQQLLRQEYEVQYRVELEQASKREASQLSQLQQSMAPPVASQQQSFQPGQAGTHPFGQPAPAPYISGYPQVPQNAPQGGGYAQQQQMQANAFAQQQPPPPQQMQQMHGYPYGQQPQQPQQPPQQPPHPYQAPPAQPYQYAQPPPNPAGYPMPQPGPGQQTNMQFNAALQAQFPGATIGQPVNSNILPQSSGYVPPQPPSAATPQQAPMGQPPSAGGDNVAKAQRLSEMGFSIDACLSALATCNGDENSALNILLGVSPAPASAVGGPSPAAAAPAPAPAKPTKPSGLFKSWGRSS